VIEDDERSFDLVYELANFFDLALPDEIFWAYRRPDLKDFFDDMSAGSPGEPRELVHGLIGFKPFFLACRQIDQDRFFHLWLF
jgi:hypothetical protein